jgi:small nuclear ribonucleoprotein (snRNP)-like protein
VEGVLTGFDPFMNLVLDNAIEITKQVRTDLFLAGWLMSFVRTIGVSRC